MVFKPNDRYELKRAINLWLSYKEYARDDYGDINKKKFFFQMLQT